MKMSPQLSLDIQAEIIKRLPVRSLIQFRSVCKAWKSLIDSSHFIAGYNAPPDQPQHLMISYEDENDDKHVCFADDDTFPQQKFSPTVPPLVKGTDMIGSSHGLLCLKRGYHRLREPQGSCPTTDVVVLWNPAIRKAIAVVEPNTVARPFDSVVGFGVCPDTKDPKLVKITFIMEHMKMESISCIPCQVMVFTLSSGEWRTSLSNQLPRTTFQFSSYCTVIGRFIYWIAYDWSAFHGKSSNLIMSFDLSTDEFREVHLPDDLHEPFLTISKLRESLVLLEHDWNINEKLVCNVYVWMMDDKKVFTNLFTIKAPDASVLWTGVFRENGEAIIGIHDDDHEDEHMFSQCALVVYDPCSQHIKDLGIRGPRCSFSGSYYTYTESLLLLNHDDGHIIKRGAVKS